MSELSEQGSRRAAIKVCQQQLARMSAQERVAWALDTLPGNHIVTSSFGAQSAVMLHLLRSQMSDIAVVVIDTGYLFPETYRFIDELSEKLKLNLQVFQSERSTAWQEARHGKRWEQGLTGLDSYHRDNKVEPMERALDSLDVGTWFAGLRRTQSRGRSATAIIESSAERWKVHPIADWNDRNVYQYLSKHDLPYHPLWEKGYISIGDSHTTRSLTEVASLEEMRFGGLKRECGLHEMEFGKTA